MAAIFGSCGVSPVAHVASTASSFFVGQQQLFPASPQNTRFLSMPGCQVLLTMRSWLGKVWVPSGLAEDARPWQMGDNVKHKYLAVTLAFAMPAVHAGEIHRYQDMNTREIAAMNAARTVVLVPGGILEQHGPYLPSGTDTFMSEHVTGKLAEAIATETDRDVLLLPLIYLGTDGANVIGDRHVFPGTLTVRPETLRQVYMDLGDALGEAGFRSVFLVHVHGAPRHNLMLDMASDYFNETWNGAMVHLYGLMPIQAQWRAYRQAMSEEAVAAQGFSVHASAAEHSAVTYLKPDLVAPDLAHAPDWRAEDHSGMVALARKPDWPGYFGAPRFASREAGKDAMDAVAKKSVEIALEILDGASLEDYPRFSASREAAAAPALETARQRARQEAWLEKAAGDNAARR